ncbi:MAG: Holliday junction resolvase RuvX [Defluviitaleaceae bacterium]|nr:Holliday junction resolvase RuvX [Defluviitaleaceae bacterium]
MKAHNEELYKINELKNLTKPHSSKILGIDYGEIRIGVAISDETNTIALPFKTLIKKDEYTIKPLISELKELIKAENIEKIILGNPLNMNGTKGDRALKTEDFKERLHRNFKKLEIILWDERLTSVQAEKILIETGNKERQNIDQVAATLILQAYLDKENNGKQTT